MIDRESLGEKEKAKTEKRLKKLIGKKAVSFKVDNLCNIVF